jgi:hypothetical protein
MQIIPRIKINSKIFYKVNEPWKNENILQRGMKRKESRKTRKKCKYSTKWNEREDIKRFQKVPWTGKKWKYSTKWNEQGIYENFLESARNREKRKLFHKVKFTGKKRKYTKKCYKQEKNKKILQIEMNRIKWKCFTNSWNSRGNNIFPQV